MTLRPTPSCIGLVVLLAAPGAAQGPTPVAPGDQRLVPDRISVSGKEKLHWVSAAELERIASSSSSNLKRLLPSAGWLLEASKDRYTNPQLLTDCLQFGMGGHGPVAPDSYQDLASSATAIIEGEVVAREPGLFRSVLPGHMLAVRVVRWLERDPAHPGASEAYVFYESPYTELLGLTVCRDDSEWPETPAPGDSILLFPQEDPGPAVDGRPLIQLGGLGLIFEQADDIHAHPDVENIIPQLPTRTSVATLASEAADFLGQ